MPVCIEWLADEEDATEGLNGRRLRFGCSPAAQGRAPTPQELPVRGEGRYDVQGIGAGMPVTVRASTAAYLSSAAYQLMVAA